MVSQYVVSAMWYSQCKATMIWNAMDSCDERSSIAVGLLCKDGLGVHLFSDSGLHGALLLLY